MAAWPSAWADRQSPHWATVQLASPGPFPPQPTPSGPGLRESGSRPPVDRPEPYTTDPISEPLLGLKQRQPPLVERPCGDGGGYLRCLTATPTPRPLDGGPEEYAYDDNPHLTTRPFCLQGLRRSTHPHGNSGRAVHTM